MKKILTSLLCLLALCGCTKVPEDFDPEGSTSPSTGVYQIFNSLDSKVTELYLYETGKDKGNNNVSENGLKVGGNITLTYEGNENTVLTLEYVAENGDTGKFETLHIEEAPITLLAPDARTGPTILAFEKPEGTGKYTVYNVTGGTLTELYIYEVGGEKGINMAGDGIPNGQSMNITKTTSIDAVFVLEFEADNGEEGKFETLHVEEAPISLLSADARTGATAISFEEPK